MCNISKTTENRYRHTVQHSTLRQVDIQHALRCVSVIRSRHISSSRSTLARSLSAYDNPYPAVTTSLVTFSRWKNTP